MMVEKQKQLGGKVQTTPQGLVLFFTLGVSLHDWQDAGFLHREISYYQRLAEHVGPITFVTYGDADDPLLVEGWDAIKVLSNTTGLPGQEFMMRAPDLFHEQLKNKAIFKSNQIKGADAAIRAARRNNRHAIVRGGYLLSRFIANRHINLRTQIGLWRHEFELFRKADRVFLPTAEDAAAARQRYPIRHDKVVVVPNFVDTDLFSPRDEVTCQPGLIGFVGRISAQKNLPALIEAMAGLPGVRLRLIGDGPDREMVLAKAQELGVDIEMLGLIPHEKLPELLAECEIFVLPSLYEGLPKVLLEAMACGLPVLATRVQGNEAVIRHGETGWLAADASAESIRDGLDILVRNAHLRTQMSAAAREYVIDHFSVDSVIAREVAVYEALGLV